MRSNTDTQSTILTALLAADHHILIMYFGFSESHRSNKMDLHQEIREIAKIRNNCMYCVHIVKDHMPPYDRDFYVAYNSVINFLDLQYTEEYESEEYAVLIRDLRMRLSAAVRQF